MASSAMDSYCDLMHTTRRARYFAALAATTLALSACGGNDDDNASDESPTTSSTSETQEETQEETETQTETEMERESSETESSDGSDAASGEGTVTASKSGVTFDVPDGWESINPSEILNGSGEVPQGVKDMAEAQGMEPDSYLQQISQSVDVMVVGETKDNFADNVNVLKMPSMPSASQSKSELEQIGASVDGTEEVDTSLGAAQDTTYSLSAGTVTVHGRSLAVPTDDGAVSITVSSSDAQEADKVATQILESIDKA